VTSLVHRRCGDAKAAVRRGALQLLEALLVMRASWQGYVRQLPGSADLALLEAATADPLVRFLWGLFCSLLRAGIWVLCWSPAALTWHCWRRRQQTHWYVRDSVIHLLLVCATWNALCTRT
jgi:hypothetical protein